MTIKCLKLVSGEEIMAETREMNVSVEVDKPCLVVIMGEGKLALVPWLPLATEPTAAINNAHIIHSYEPNEQLVKHYRQQTSNIQIASADQLPPAPPNFGR